MSEINNTVKFWNKLNSLSGNNYNWILEPLTQIYKKSSSLLDVILEDFLLLKYILNQL